MSTLQLNRELDRTAVEILCGFRPETVDALWKFDMEWETDRRYNARQKEFIVTTNGSFFRPEVTEYLKQLNAYTPTKDKFVLVPCAADKPYPSPLHQAVLDMMPPDYELMVVTGVLGLVPQALWPIAPYYDSGIPYEWRMFNVLRDFFGRHCARQIVAYTDFYSFTIHAALYDENKPCKLDFVDPPIRRNGYLDLMAPERLSKLKALMS